MKNNSSKRRVLVLAIDGYTWDLIRSWAELGKLPTIRKLIKKGVRGKLESTIPPLTGPAWVSFATGKNPGKHGCYDFLLPRSSLSNTQPISTRDINGKTFYELLETNGMQSIVINLPCPCPPRTNTIIIASFLAQGENYVFPSNLIDEIPELKNYRILPDLSSPEIVESINDFRKVERIRFTCSKELFKKNWDFFFLLFNITDWIQHVMYDKLISQRMPEDSEAMKAFKEIDEYIGWFVNNVPRNTNIFVISDHGFCLYKKKFAINRWLMEEGYLKAKPKKRGIIQKFRGMAGLSLKYLPLLRFFYTIVNRTIFHTHFLERLILNIEPDLSKTIAYSIGTAAGAYGSIYINRKERFDDGIIETEKYRELRNEIIEKLKKLKEPETGKNVAKYVFRKDDIYSGMCLENAPDIILISNGYDITVKDVPMLFNWAESGHSLDGIFISYGPDIKKGVEIDGVRIYDIAPTILHMLNVPIPKDMDGRVPKKIFKEDSEMAKKEVVYQEVNERERIREKIKKLRI